MPCGIVLPESKDLIPLGSCSRPGSRRSGLSTLLLARVRSMFSWGTEDSTAVLPADGAVIGADGAGNGFGHPVPSHRSGRTMSNYRLLLASYSVSGLF